MARRLVMALPVLLFLTLVGHCHGGKIGVCYGRNADDLPAPDKVAQLIKQQSIKYVRIYDTNIDVIKAFANTGVELMVGVPNSDLLAFSQYQSNVDTWLKNSIMPYYPATMITYITVGAEVTESPVNVSALVVPAMRNVHTALKKVGLHKRARSHLERKGEGAGRGRKWKAGTGRREERGERERAPPHRSSRGVISSTVKLA